MTFTSPRATYDETLAFANAVREAGGGNPLDALMPAVPEDSSQCLVAKNLNFKCNVDTTILHPNLDNLLDSSSVWVMHINDQEVRDRIAGALDLEPFDQEIVINHTFVQNVVPACGVVLPPEIAQVAKDFDCWDLAIYWDEDDNPILDESASVQDLDCLRAFWPYIEASVKEAYANASFVNEKGELVL